MKTNLCLLLLILFPFAAYAQSADLARPGTAPRIELDLAPIVVDGRKVHFISGIPAYPAKRRAREIAHRIEAFAADPDLNPDDLRLEETEKTTKIVGPTGTIVEIHRHDIEVLGGKIERSDLARTSLTRIREVVTAYREDRKSKVLLGNVGRAVGLTVIAVLALFAGRWGFRKFSAWVEARVPEQLEKVEAKSFSLVQANQIWRILRGTVRLVILVVGAVLGYLYVNAVLSLFPWTRFIALHLVDLVIAPLETVGNSIIGYLPNLVFLIIIVFIFRYVLKLLKALFGSLDRQRITFSGFEPEWSWPTYRLVRLLVIAFGVVLAYPYIPGSDSDAFKGVSIFLGVLASIGSSSVISNVVAGYSMTYRKAFKVGDRVQIGETVGDVTQMRLLVTHLKTVKNEEVVIPNSVVLNNEVKNFSSLAREQGLILHTTVGIGYEVPWRQVEAMLLMAAERTDGLVTGRKPFVLPTALADFAINYELNVYVDDATKMASLYKALHYNIVDVFNEYGVAIMTPSYESDPEEAKLVAKENWYAAPATPPSNTA